MSNHQHDPIEKTPPSAPKEAKGLWTPDDCAAYLEVARWTFVNRISKLPTFPKPKVELSRRTRRWDPEDIRDWRFSYRGGRRRA